MTRKHRIVLNVFFLMIPLAYAVCNRVSTTDDGRYRYIKSNGIPEHSTWQFPNRGNQNPIS